MDETDKIIEFETNDGKKVTSIRDVAADVIASRKPREQRPVNHRLTVISTLYHQVSGGEARDYPMRYSRDLVSNEQVYDRTTTLGTEHKRVPLGWLADEGIAPGLIVIQNRSKNAVVFICIDGGATRLRVMPGEFQSLCPEDASQVLICASAPDTEFRVVAVPE